MPLSGGTEAGSRVSEFPYLFSESAPTRGNGMRRPAACVIIPTMFKTFGLLSLAPLCSRSTCHATGAQGSLLEPLWADTDVRVISGKTS